MNLPSQDFAELLNASDPSADADVKVQLSRVAMEVNSRLQAGFGHSAEYVADAIHALKAIQGTSNADLRINILLDAAQFFYLVGQTFNAIEPATDAVEIADKSDSKSLLRKSLTFAGVLYADTGNSSRAIECYAQALDIARELRDSEGECAVWVNLGVALLYAAQYRDAISCLEHTVHLAGTVPSLMRAAALAAEDDEQGRLSPAPQRPGR